MEDAQPADRPRWWRRRLTWWIAGGAALVVVIGVIGFALTRPESPTTVVRGYLEALSRGDLSAATAIARPDQPANGQSTFLNRAAPRTGWKIRAVTEIHDGEDNGAQTLVRAVISGTGGVSDGIFTVVKDDDSWRIPQPYVQVSFRASQLRYVDVNGKAAPVATPETRGDFSLVGDKMTYALHPGDYRFYAKSSPSVQVTAKSRTLLPYQYQGTGQPKEDISATVKITPAGLAKIQQAVRARVDLCVKDTDITAPKREPCPFGPDESDDRVETPSGEVEISSSYPVRWKVVRYPTVAIAPGPAGAGGYRSAIVTTGMGAVTLTGMGESADNRIVPFTATCPIAEPYDVTFASDGTPTVTTALLYDNREYPC